MLAVGPVVSITNELDPEALVFPARSLTGAIVIFAVPSIYVPPVAF